MNDDTATAAARVRLPVKSRSREGVLGNLFEWQDLGPRTSKASPSREPWLHSRTGPARLVSSVLFAR
jgi:hypothetical protein